MAFDRHGRLFFAALCPVFSGLGTLDFRMAVATFDRDGSRFVQAVRVDPTPPPGQESVRSTDKENLAVDLTGGRHDGNVYVSYLECAGPGTRGPCSNETESVIHVVRSTDHGKTFSPPAVIVGPEGRFTSWADLAVGPDGTVYVTFRSSPTSGLRPIWISRSTDGGRPSPRRSSSPGFRRSTLTSSGSSPATARRRVQAEAAALTRAPQRVYDAVRAAVTPG